MSTQETIARKRSASESVDNVDVAASASAEKSPNADADSNQEGKTKTLDKSETVADSETNAEETPSLEAFMNNTVSAMINLEPAASATANDENDKPPDQQNANQEPKTPAANQLDPNALNPDKINSIMETIVPQSCNELIEKEHAAKITEKAEVITPAANQLDSNDPNHNTNNATKEAIIPEPCDVLTEKEHPAKITEKVEVKNPAANRRDSNAQNHNTDNATKKAIIPEPCDGLIEKGHTAKITEKVEVKNPAANRRDSNAQNHNTDNAAKEAIIPESCTGLIEKGHTEKITERAEVKNPAANQLDFDAPNPDTNNAIMKTIVPESGNGLTEKEHAAEITEKAAVDQKKIDPSKPSIKSRTRSLSSAMSSSLSGWESNEDGATDSIIFDNDGKTPLRTNRMASHGPVRKRRKKKGRALFRSNAPEPLQKTNATADSREDALPPLENEGGLSSVTFANSRPRSNTIDSFRAAMDSQLIDLPTESIVLPEMKEGEDLSTAEQVEDIFGSNNNPFHTQRSRSDSQLMDLPTESIVLPEMKHSEMKEGEDTSLSNAGNVEDMFGSNNYPSHTPRSRSDSQLLIGLPTESLVLPEMKHSEMKEGEDTSLSNAENVEDIFGSNNYLSHTPRSRSDTIDFLTSAVEFQVDDDFAVNVDEIHPTPVDMTNETMAKPTVIKRVEINLETPSSLKSDVMGEKNESRSQGNNFRKGVAFGKTPKKTNRSRAASESVSFHQGPVRKRYRTRSLSFAVPEKESSSKTSTDTVIAANGVNEDDIATESENSASRIRSNTLDSIQNAVFGGRNRSDTMDFLTAAVAGDMGHDLDAALAAAADDGASFAMHPISAPSGASMKYNPRPAKRPRSDTLDSTASSINSSKLDFFLSVAAEQGDLTSPVPAEVGLRERTESGASEHFSDFPHRRPRSNTLEIYSNMNMASSARARSDTVDFLIGANDDDPVGNIDEMVTLPDNCDENTANSNVLDHLKALCDEPKITGSKTARILGRKRRANSNITDGLASPRPRKNSEATWKTNFSQDFMNSLTRNRLESWGGMSDLSVGAAHTALKDTGILDDILAAAADLGGDDTSEGASSLERTGQVRTESGGSNSLSGLATTKKGRPRMDSLASLSLASLSDTSISISGPKEKPNLKTDGKMPATASVSTPSIIVDYDAIASAVSAANAAIDGMDLFAILGEPSSTKQKVNSGKTGSNLPTKPSYSQYAHMHQSATKPLPSMRSGPQAKNAHPNPLATMPPIRATSHLNATPQTIISGSKIDPFPVTSINIPFVPIPKSTKTKEEMDAIRERARAAAGYVPPTAGGKTPAKRPPPRTIKTPSFNPHLNPPYHPGMPTNIPMKKRGLAQNAPRTQMPDYTQSHPQTPLSYMKPGYTPSSTVSAKSGTLQSQQKWDDMFECLVKFIEDIREKSTKHMNDQQKAAWIWDGNVPTSYKTPCGKALGRWINNQRSAKAKGTLKDDREVRLVSTGLKWSVLTTNSWRQMLRELEIYVHEQTKDGRTWDGNVPTNHKIKSNTTAGGAEIDEEKNLGRWVNRQRSLFQAGKLKKDRQRDLERIGLKWSVLLTTSWSTMYDSLSAYAEEKRKQSPHGWDGNVPANYKTRANPPLSLGRWVNRQRSAHAKGRLKDEYVRKLEAAGLKWVIHARTRINELDDEDDFVGGEFIQGNAIQNNMGAPLNVSFNGNTAQGSSISNVVLPPLGNAFVNNTQFD